MAHRKLVNYFGEIYIIIMLITALLTQFACKPAPPKMEERVDHYIEGGGISRRTNFVDGKREGKMTDYYPAGELMAERWFKNGHQEGKTMIYYPSGARKEVQYYHEGAQTSGDTIWYEDGRIQFTVSFINNKKNGYLHKWGPDGVLIFESKYAMDTLIEVKGQVISRESINSRTESDTIIRTEKQ